MIDKDADQEFFPTRWRKGYTGHHVRPSSRGGNSSRDDNVIETHDKTRHQPFHRLFCNLWPHEVAVLLFFSWTTQVPGENRARWTRDSLWFFEHAWELLFGEVPTLADACSVLRYSFAKTQETRLYMDYAQRLFAYADAHNVGRIEGTVATIPGRWQDDRMYTRIFGTLYPHEAMLLAFVCWNTICPHRERVLPGTLLDEEGNPAKSAFIKRIEAWDALFGKEAGPWDVVALLERRYGGTRHSPYRRLFSRVKHICRQMERSGLLQR